MAHPVIQACIARARRRPFLILFSVLSLSAFIGLDILMWFYMPKNHVVGQSSLELPVNATLQASAARIGQLPDAGDPFSAAARQFHTLPPSIRNPPKHRLLIVVPFRDAAPSHLAQGQGRWANLAQFVPAITNHLRQSGKRPHVDFSILVVEQTQGLLFNKGALLNAGYHIARAWGYDYMALHDVDQIPEIIKNDYAYPEKPTHLCVASDQYGYRPAYESMLGGVVALTLEHFSLVNGFSNDYWGWGQEDDDFYFRISKSSVGYQRLSPRIGRYRTLYHPRFKRVGDIFSTAVYLRGKKKRLAIEAGEVSPYEEGVSTLRFTPIRYVRDYAEGPLHVVTVRLHTEYRPVNQDGLQAKEPL